MLLKLKITSLDWKLRNHSTKLLTYWRRVLSTNHRSQNSSSGIVTIVDWTSKDSGFDCRYGLDTASGHAVERYRRAGGHSSTYAI